MRAPARLETINNRLGYTLCSLSSFEMFSVRLHSSRASREWNDDVWCASLKAVGYDSLGRGGQQTQSIVNAKMNDAYLKREMSIGAKLRLGISTR